MRSVPFLVRPVLAVALLFVSIAHAQDPAKVRTQAFAEIAQPVTGRAAARVVSPNDSLISAEVSARVLRVHADAGAVVAVNALLVELDATDYQLALAQAEAQLAAAKARLTLAQQRAQRGEQLREQRHIAEDELLALATQKLAAEADLQLAEAARRSAARNVEKTRIHAPFAGVVLERHAQVGALAAPGTPLLRLVDTAVPEVEAQLAPEDAEALATASRMVFSAGGDDFPLQLLRRAPVIEPASRTVLVRLGFAGARPPAGSAGELIFGAAARQLPSTLAVQRDSRLGVFIADNGQARFVPVPGALEGRPLRIDLPAHARVVVQGQQGLQDGAAVVEATE